MSAPDFEDSDEPIVRPQVLEHRSPFVGVHALGHLLWIGVMSGLVGMSGKTVHYVALLGSLGLGGSLFAFDSSRWRWLVWTAWALTLFGVYRGLARRDPTDVPWWGAPSLIFVIVACAYVLWRLGRARLRRERRGPPLDLG